MKPVVLDATAVLALLQEEPGAERVVAALPDAAISAVNLNEVVGKLADSGMPEPAIRAALGALGLDVHPFDEDQAYQAGLLRPATSRQGLSLADRACLALGCRLDRPVLTADQAWASVKAGVEVRVIRELPRR